MSYFRYRCLQCINYNLCQNCFLCGHLNKRHKENHQVQEFCHPVSILVRSRLTISFCKIILNLFEFKLIQMPKQSYKNVLRNLCGKKSQMAMQILLPHKVQEIYGQKVCICQTNRRK